MWENERTTNDNLNRLVEEHYLHQAFEAIDLAEGRGNRLVFLTRTGMTWVLQKGHVREEDIAYYWRGEGHWYPSYNEHAVAVHDVLAAFVKRASEVPEQAIDIRLDPHAPLDGSPKSSLASSPLQDNTLIPDRVFAVKHHGRVAEFYLEVDLGTESQAQWQAKMKKYLASPEVMAPPGAYVLTVANSRQRRDTLLRWSQDMVDERFLFSTLDDVCYTYNRDGKELVLVRAGAPFSAVWRVASDEKLHALFDI